MYYFIFILVRTITAEKIINFTLRKCRVKVIIGIQLLIIIGMCIIDVFTKYSCGIYNHNL